MVAIAPNLFQIEGIVTAVGGNNAPQGFCEIKIRLQKVEHLQGPSSFLDASEEEIAVLFPAATAGELTEEMHLQCKIRRSPGGFVVLPDSINAKPETKG